jgi:DNA primase large subunit
MHTNVLPQVLTELETCTFRNRTQEETQTYMTPLLQKYLPLQSNSARSDIMSQEERRRDHYSHFILRLAFSKTEELRRRFSRLETMLFRIRYKTDDTRECNDFIKSLDFAWETVSAEEKERLGDSLKAATGSTFIKKENDIQDYFKVEWEQVPELVEQRRVFLSQGMAYVPTREQMTLVVSEFSKRLDIALEVRLLRAAFSIILLTELLTIVDIPRSRPS